MKRHFASIVALMIIGSLSACQGDSASLQGSNVSNGFSPSAAFNPWFVDAGTESNLITSGASGSFIYTIKTAPVGGTATLDAATGILSYTSQGTGYIDSIEVSVSDGVTTESFSIPVYVGNLSPAIISDAEINVNAGAAAVITLEAFELNPADALSWSIAAGASLNGAIATVTDNGDNTASLSYFAGDSGADSVEVSVTDSAGAFDSIVVPVIVVDTEVPNNAPVPTVSPSSFNVDAGATVALTISANDPDVTDSHTLTLASVPSFGAATVEGLVVTYTAGEAAGSESFTVHVQDSAGAIGSVVVTGTVTSVVIEPTGGDPVNGQAIMQSVGCLNAGCHANVGANPNNIQVGADAAALSQALQTVFPMSLTYDIADFSDADLDDMAAYIDTLVQ